jgi:acyl-CoA thioester hydrolase
VVETQCNYFSPLSFPQPVQAGLRVAHAGRSSVRYEIALFAQDQERAAAAGHFVHVYVDRLTRRPIDRFPEALEKALQPLKAHAHDR